MTTAPARKVLQTTAEISKSIHTHYATVQEAKKEGKPVIWSFGLIPREIFEGIA